MPGVGVAAAVLGLVEAGLALVLVAAVLVDEADRYSYSGDSGLLALILLVLLGLAGITAVGSVLVLRRTTRALLVGATVAELVAIAGLWVVVLVEFSTDDVVGYGGGEWAAATAMAVVAATTPVVRLVLVSRPSVTVWISDRRPAEPVWSAEQQQWVAPRSSTAGVVLAVLVPVLILLAMTAVVLSTQEEGVGYLDPPGISGD